METIIIGIAGGSCSGKSTFTKRLKDAFQDKITVINHDNYYKCHDDIPFEERKKINYDHPDALETDLLIQHVKELKKGNPIECPIYDFTQHNRSKETYIIYPSRIMIIEGILVFENKELLDLMDIKVFVEADADDRIMRRALRDVRERGRDLEGIFEQYVATVKPMHDMYVEPSKKYADFILNSGMNQVAFDVISARIKELLNEN
ncbi:MAG: uridine kinase [Firmicutes bacterium]|nr:uridine kinase [Bacillota bacterium]